MSDERLSSASIIQRNEALFREAPGSAHINIGCGLKPKPTQMVSWPTKLAEEPDGLSKTTKLALENRGVYGQWLTSSCSPCPGPLLYTLPQRHSVLLKERQLEVVDSGGIHLGENLHHKDLAKLLRHEECLGGQRCYCEYPYEHDTSHGLGTLMKHFNLMQRCLLLTYTLFQLSDQYTGYPIGQGYTLMKNLKYVCRHSRLAWDLFGLKSDSTPAEDETVYVCVNNPPELRWHLRNVRQDMIDWGHAIGEATGLLATKMINLFVVDSPSSKGRDLTSVSGSFITDKSTHGYSKPMTIEDQEQENMIDILKSYLEGGKYVYRKYQELKKCVKDAYGALSGQPVDDPIFISSSQVLTEESQQKLDHLIRKLEDVESHIIHKLSPIDDVRVTFSDVALALLLHSDDSILPFTVKAAMHEEAKKKNVQTAKTECSSGGTDLSQFALDDLLGFSLKSDPRVAIGIWPQPRLMTFEPFKLRTGDPLQLEIQNLLEKFPEMSANPIVLQPNAIEKSDPYSFKPWWRRSDVSQMDADRDHLAEIRLEQNLLNKSLKWAPQDGPNGGGETVGHTFRRKQTLREGPPPEVDLSTLEPPPLPADLYGAIPPPSTKSIFQKQFSQDLHFFQPPVAKRSKVSESRSSQTRSSVSSSTVTTPTYYTSSSSR